MLVFLIEKMNSCKKNLESSGRESKKAAVPGPLSTAGEGTRWGTEGVQLAVCSFVE